MPDETQVIGTAVAIPYGVRPPLAQEVRMAKKTPAALKAYTFKKGSAKAKAMAKKGGRKSPKKRK